MLSEIVLIWILIKLQAPSWCFLADWNRNISKSSRILL